MSQGNRIEIDASGFFEETIGQAGIARREVLALARRFNGLQQRLRTWRAGAAPSFLALPFAPRILLTSWRVPTSLPGASGARQGSKCAQFLSAGFIYSRESCARNFMGLTGLNS